MPDGYMNYTGDQATVMPDNTQALMHFSNLFAQQAQERQAQKLAQQKAEQERISKGVSYLGNAFDPKKYTAPDLVAQKVHDDLTQSTEELSKMYKDNPNMNMADLQMEAIKRMQNIRDYVDKANAIKAAATSATASFQGDPSVDSPMATDLMLHDSLMKDDGSGNKVLRSYNELPSVSASDLYNQTLANHADKIIKPGDLALRHLLADPNPIKDTAPSVFDAHGNLVKSGGSTVIPFYQEKNVDAKGNLLGVKLKTEPYVVDGKQVTEPVKDANGNVTYQPVRVVPDATYHEIMDRPSSVSASINLAFQKQYPNVDPESPMADLLKRKILTDKMSTYATGSFKANDDAKEGSRLKHQAFSEAMQRANLSNSNARLGIAETLLKMKKDKAASGEDIAGYVPDFLGSANENYGTDAEVEDQAGKPAVSHWFSPNEPAVPPTYKTVRIIPATADPKDLNIIAGKPDASGQRPVPPKTFTLKDGTKVQGYQYDPTTGNATGDGGVEINRQSVQREFLNHMKKGVLNDLNPPQQTPVQKVVSKVKAIGNKIKGSNKKMY